jgi:hypothetical protein
VSTRQCHTPVRPPTLDCAVRLRLRRTHVLCRLRLGSCAQNSAVPPLREWTGDATAGALVATLALAALWLRTVRYGVGLRRRWTKRFGLTQVTAATADPACNMQHTPLRVGGSRRLGLRHTRLRLPCAVLCAVLHLACRTAAPSVAHRKLELAARIVASHMAPRRTLCSTRTAAFAA